MTFNRKFCDGCTDDYYNDTLPVGCWHKGGAKVVRRFKLGWSTAPTVPGAFTEVEVHKCHRAPGRYALYEKPPTFATEVKRLPE